MIYDLGFPNREVSAGFNRWLANAYMRPGTDVSKTSGWAVACQRSLRRGDTDGFMEALESFFSAIGYDLTDRLSEQAYQCVAVAILRFIGIYLDAEVRTSRGRIDMVMRAPGHVFVMEMKVASGEGAGNAAAQAALAQIRKRGYAEPYRSSGNEVICSVWPSTALRTTWVPGWARSCSRASWRCSAEQTSASVFWSSTKVE